MLLCRYVPVLCLIYNHLSNLMPKIYFGILHIIAFEFEDDVYPSKRNAWVVWYTQYIVNVKQYVLVVLKAVGF